MRFRTILFDFDGTLAPSLPCWLRAFRSIFISRGLNVTDGHIIEQCFFRPFGEVGERFDLGSADDVRALVYGELPREFESVDLYDGVLDFLEAGRGAGTTFGIVTSCPRENVAATLKRHGAWGYFETVVAAEDIAAHKPDPAPIHMALSRLGADASSTLFVGDYVVDVEAGRAAGCTTALFLPPESSLYYDVGRLKAMNPDIVASSYAELSTKVAVFG